MRGVPCGIILQLPLPCLNWENSLISQCWNTKSSGSHREVLSCFNTRQLPCFVFKTLSPCLQLALGDWKLCIFEPFVCYTPCSQSELGWLAEQTGLPCTVPITLSKTEMHDFARWCTSCPFKNRFYTEIFDDCMAFHQLFSGGQRLVCTP